MGVPLGTVAAWAERGIIPPPMIQRGARRYYSPEAMACCAMEIGTRYINREHRFEGEGNTPEAALSAIRKQLNAYVEPLADFPEGAADVRYHVTVEVQFSGGAQ